MHSRGRSALRSFGEQRAPQTLWGFVVLGRPHFLLGGIGFQLLGALIAVQHGARFYLGAAVWAQVVVTSIQWMTHYVNEYFDLRADSTNPHRTWWSGGSRVLVEGRLLPTVALGAAIALGVIGATAAVWLSLSVTRSPSLLVLLLVSLATSRFYSAPPFRLLSTGWGEGVSAIIVAGLVPLAGFLAQVERAPWGLFPALAPLLALQFAMLIVVSLPDVASDGSSGKRTLAVRIGSQRAARLAIAAMAGALLVLPICVALDLDIAIAAAMAALALPLAVVQTHWLIRGDGVDPVRANRVTTTATLLVAVALVVELLAFSGVLMRVG